MLVYYFSADLTECPGSRCSRTLRLVPIEHVTTAYISHDVFFDRMWSDYEFKITADEILVNAILTLYHITTFECQRFRLQ